MRYAAAMLIALGFHLLLFQLIMFKSPEPFEVKEDVIAVALITLPPTPQIVDPVELPPEIDEAPAPPPPKVIPKPKPITPSAPRESVDAPDILASSRAATADEAGNAVPLPETGTTAIDSQSAANEARIDEGLKALAADLSCLKGFTEDCADIREDVFEEFQMTETDKVYTKKYAHTGLPVAFYGLSERQIREKLNLKFAGENGIYIPFTNIGIDGGIWDALHGVNKGCEWKSGIDELGKYAPIKDCPDYLPAAKEDRDRRNKFQRQAIK